MFVQFGIVTLLIALSRTASTLPCTDGSYLITIVLSSGGYVRKRCAGAVKMRPEICHTNSRECCASCKKLRESRPNAPKDCPYGDEKGLFMGVNEKAKGCRYIYENNNLMCTQPSKKKRCCDACATKYGACRDISKLKLFDTLGWAYGCADLRKSPVLQSAVCAKHKQICCSSCEAPSSCKDLTAVKTIDLLGKKFGCADLVKSSPLQSALCVFPSVKGLCCNSCKAPSGCHDLTTETLRFQNGTTFTCTEINNNPQRRSALCKHWDVKCICCKGCRAQN